MSGVAHALNSHKPAGRTKAGGITAFSSSGSLAMLAAMRWAGTARPTLLLQAAFKAFSIHPIKWSSRSGLFRKQTAPAFMARARTLSLG